MQNIKDPDQKIQWQNPKNHTLSTIYPPVHTFIKMFQIFLLKEEKLEHETKNSFLHTDC